MKREKGRDKERGKDSTFYIEQDKKVTRPPLRKKRKMLGNVRQILRLGYEPLTPGFDAFPLSTGRVVPLSLKYKYKTFTISAAHSSNS